MLDACLDKDIRDQIFYFHIAIYKQESCGYENRSEDTEIDLELI